LQRMVEEDGRVVVRMLPCGVAGTDRTPEDEAATPELSSENRIVGAASW